MPTTTKQDNQFRELLAQQIADAEWVLDWIRQEFAPEDVFSQEDLEYWAENNGYVLAK